MSNYLIEKGGASGHYLVNHMFDARHGLATIGDVTRTEDGKWKSTCRDLPIGQPRKTRAEAADDVFKYWSENFSKEAYSQKYSEKTKGGYRVEFTHGAPGWIVASSSEIVDGIRRRFSSTWVNGKYTMAPEVDGKRSDAWDLVLRNPKLEASPPKDADIAENDEAPAKKIRSMRP